MIHRILNIFKPEDKFKDVPLVIPTEGTEEEVVFEFNKESIMMPVEAAREVMNDLTVFFHDRDIIKKPEHLENIFDRKDIFLVTEMPNLEKLIREWNEKKEQNPETD